MGKTSNDICLVSPPDRATSLVIPIALMSLSAWLEGSGIQSEIVDVKRDQFARIDSTERSKIIGEIVERVQKIDAPYVGLTAFTSDYHTVMELAKQIRKVTKAKIIVGGVHATLRPHDFLLTDSPVDFVVVGEGEETLTELIEVDSRGELAHHVAGLIFRDRDGIVATEVRPVLKDLATCPMPAYHQVDMRYYTRPNRGVIRLLLLSGVHIFTSRGCPYECAFCANRVRKVRYRPVEQVVDELEYLKANHDIESFYVMDDTFSIKKERVYKFLDELQARDLDLIWAAETRVNLVDREMLKAMREAGCMQLDFGVESGSQAALDRMRKGITVEQIRENFAACHELGIRTYANWMYNTPGETEEDVQLTFALMRNLKSTVGGSQLCMPLLGTKIYEDYVHPQLTIDEYRLFERSDLFSTLIDDRFKMAAHDINLTSLFVRGAMAVRGWRSFFDLTSDRRYWRTLWHSRRKAQYVGVLGNIAIRQLKVYLQYGKQWVKTRIKSE